MRPSPSAAVHEYSRYLEQLAAQKGAGVLPASATALTLGRFIELGTALRCVGVTDLVSALLPPTARRRHVYLASPLGFGEAGREYLGSIVQDLAQLGLVVENPWDHGAELHAAEEGVELGSRNFQRIAACGRVLAVLDGPDVDSGTAAEMGFAFALGMRIDGLRSDPRRTGECPGLDVNLQVASTVALSGGRVIRSRHDLAALYGDPVAASGMLAEGDGPRSSGP